MKILMEDIKKLLKNYYYLKLNNLCPELTSAVDEILEKSDTLTKKLTYSKYYKKESQTKYSIDNYISPSQISRKLKNFRNNVFLEFYNVPLTPEIKSALVYLRKL